MVTRVLLEPGSAYLGDDLIRVVTGVGYERSSLRVPPNDLWRHRRFVLLARREFEVERVTLGVDEP